VELAILGLPTFNAYKMLFLKFTFPWMLICDNANPLVASSGDLNSTKAKFPSALIQVEIIGSPSLMHKFIVRMAVFKRVLKESTPIPGGMFPM
jgi:hypothetical protein